MAGPRLSYRYSRLNNETTKFLTYVIIVFNIIFAVLGAMMIALGLYMLFESDFRRWIIDLGMEQYWVGVYILLAAGVFTMLQTFFGVLGAYQKKRFMLLLFAVSMFICIILEIAGAVYMLKNGLSYSNIEVWLYDRFMFFISVYDVDEQSKRTMSIIQEWVGCCGANGVYDYVKWNKVIPSTCYDPVNGNAWYKSGYGYVGCVRGFTFYIEGMTGWISGIALTLAFLQVFALIAAVLLSMAKNEFKKSTMSLNR